MYVQECFKKISNWQCLLLPKVICSWETSMVYICTVALLLKQTDAFDNRLKGKAVKKCCEKNS